MMTDIYLKTPHVGDHWSVPGQSYIGAPMYDLWYVGALAIHLSNHTSEGWLQSSSMMYDQFIIGGMVHTSE